MKRDEEREPDAEDGEGNEEMAVSEDGGRAIGGRLECPMNLTMFEWRKHKDVVG